MITQGSETLVGLVMLDQHLHIGLEKKEKRKKSLLIVHGNSECHGVEG